MDGHRVLGSCLLWRGSADTNACLEGGGVKYDGSPRPQRREMAGETLADYSDTNLHFDISRLLRAEYLVLSTECNPGFFVVNLLCLRQNCSFTKYLLVW